MKVYASTQYAIAKDWILFTKVQTDLANGNICNAADRLMQNVEGDRIAVRMLAFSAWLHSDDCIVDKEVAHDYINKLLGVLDDL